MDLMNERCAGLDVHKKSVVACVRTPARSGGSRRRKVTRTFATTMAGLVALRDWLGSEAVTHAALESTGVYWRPVYAVLEPHFELLLVNARHVKQVPGRKTDVKDCEWLAQLLECGLLRGSFVPPPEFRDLRDLTRLRKVLVRERSRQINRVAKTLELANVKLGSVVSDIMGRTGRAILEAMIEGEEDPHALADLARGSLRRKRKQLAEVVPGLIRDHHRFLLRDLLGTIDHLSRRIDTLEVRIEEATRPFSAVLDLLQSVPGVRRRSAEAILAEIGDDMTRFPTARQFASWARVCPGNHESAGKRKPTSTGKGNTWLRDALSQVAWGAARTKSSYYRTLYYRHRSRGGPKKSIVVVQHAILTAIWHMLSTDSFHQDLGPDHLKRDKARQTRHLLARLKKLGVDVHVREKPA